MPTTATFDSPNTPPDATTQQHWLAQIRTWAQALGFRQVGIAAADPATDLSIEAAGLDAWLAAGCHGDMHYMAAHRQQRCQPAVLHPGTTRIISVALDYWPTEATPAQDILEAPERAYISRYALGRDYHKVVRQRLQQLAEKMAQELAPHHFRVFSDSAPVMEVAFAARNGLGWRGKHTLLLSRDAGSYFFLGEIFTDLPLPLTASQAPHCGRCTACIDACPTGAITAPYRLDARRCISYLTIEHHGSIPEALRPLLGNRIYGCDDCQHVCPWNRFARTAALPDFANVRHRLDNSMLVELFAWDEATFLRNMEGSAIRRIGHERWLRNIAVALGNALRKNMPEPARAPLIAALQQQLHHPSALVREHVQWALAPSPTS